jgi:hypothetical protein
MRTTPLIVLAVLCLVPLASAQSAPIRTPVLGAQPAAAPASIANTADPAIAAVVSAVMPSSSGLGPVKGAPFSATQTTVREQTLADGTIIKSTVEVQLWRDAEGRMRAESTLKPAAGSTQQGHVVTVWNPLDGKAITWVNGNQASNFASVIHLPELQLNGMMGAAAPPTQGTSLRQRVTSPPVALASSPTPATANIRTETLSPDTIAGLEVTGTRTTQVVPAGTVDNDRDFTVTSETWTSPEMKIIVRQFNSDPRTGTVTTELTNIDRSEPDPALFKPPAGYKVAENHDPGDADSGAKR